MIIDPRIPDSWYSTPDEEILENDDEKTEQLIDMMIDEGLGED